MDPESGVVAVEFCHEISHSGRFLEKKETKCCWTLRWPGVPGTRGMRMGARSPEAVLVMSKSEVRGDGRDLSWESERGW